MRHYAILALLLFTLTWTVSAQETVTPGTPVEGAYTGEPVVYTVDASQGQLIIASMVSEAFDTYLAITDDGEEIASDDDSGESNNAILAYVAQADGTVTIEASASYFSDETGDYTLTVDVIEPAVATFDTPLTLEAGTGAAQLYAIFEGTTGQVVNIAATSAGEEDVTVSIVGTDASEIDRDDDDGPAANALLRRVVLPADGTYLIKISQAFSDDLLIENVDLLVEATEQLFLSETPQPLMLGDGEGQIGTEVFTVEVEAGTSYRFIFTIEPLPDEEGGIKLELLDTARFFDPELDVQHATGVTWDFVPNASGTIRLDVHPTLFVTDLQSIEYTAALEVIAE